MPLHPDFERLYTPESAPATPTRWLPISARGVVVEEREGAPSALLADTPERSALFAAYEPLTLGRLNGITYRTCEVPDNAEAPEGSRAVEFRKLYGRLSEQEWLIAGYATQILHWRRTSGFCPVCGQPMGPMQQEWMRRCTACGHERYPQVSPAVLILVHDGADRILLAHKPGWGDRYSILAGFVLPGESLEECVHRETAEEAGVQVTDLVYTGSQPWPFPHQLMIGFNARYQGGDLQIDQQELDHAAWFEAGALPSLPAALSLSRQMIDAWARTRAS